MNTEIDRKIAVILVADVVGYSKHMEKDENATLKAYAECEKILKACLKKYKGSIFNTAGDSALAEFPSAVNAVECGVAFQNDIKKRNDSDKTEVKLEFRIGINMGDVVKKEGNLFGDGVNIAARLEGLAQPNGISISKSVYDLVVPKTKMTFNDLGVQKVKQNEFHAFDILLDPSQKRKLKTKSRSMLPILGGVVVILLLISGFFYFIGQHSVIQQVDTQSDPSKKRVLGRNLMIAPFENKSGSTKFDYIAEGISDHLTNSLTSSVLLNIIPKSQSYKIIEENLSFQDLVDKYDISYLLNGTTLVANEKFRINLELIDIHEEKVIWSANEEYLVNDIFSAQDNVELLVIKSLQKNLTMGEALSEAFAESFKERQDYKKILNLRFTKHSEKFSASEDSELPYKELLSSQPDNAMLNYLFAKSIMTKLTNFRSNDRKKDIRDMEEALRKSIELDPDISLPYPLLAYIGEGNILGNFISDEKMKERRQVGNNLVQKGLELGPNNVETLFYSGMYYKRVGKYDNAISLFERAIKLAPFGPEAIRVNLIGTHLSKFDFDTAREIAETIFDQGDKRSTFIASMFFAYINAKTNKVEEAKTNLKDILENYKYTKTEAIYQIRRYGPGSWTWFSTEFKTTMESL